MHVYEICNKNQTILFQTLSMYQEREKQEGLVEWKRPAPLKLWTKKSFFFHGFKTRFLEEK